MLLGLLRKFVEKLPICLKSNKKDIGHLTGRPKYVYIVDSSTKYSVA